MLVGVGQEDELMWLPPLQFALRQERKLRSIECCGILNLCSGFKRVAFHDKVSNLFSFFFFKSLNLIV